jgi:hypothetical protein
MDKPTILLIILNLLLVILIFLTRSRKSISKIFLLLGSILLTLSLVEIAYRLFMERETYYTGNFNMEFYERDSTLGYKMERAGKFKAVKINSNKDTLFQTYYTIIEDTSKAARSFPHRIGYRNSMDSNELIFLGCSFTFGEGLTDKQSLPYLTGEQNELNSVNLGCTGYGLHQVYQLYLEKYSNTDNRHRRFVYSFLYDHILRANGVYDWNLEGPQFISKGDSIINMGPIIKLHSAFANKFIHYASLFGGLRFLNKILSHLAEKNHLNSMDAVDYENSLNLLKQMAKMIKSSGGEFIVLDWDFNNWGNIELNQLPYELIEKNLDQLNAPGIRVIRISTITNLQDPSNFIPGDGHPSAWMNYKIANYLGNTIQSSKEARGRER